MAKFLDKTGLNTFWAKIKSLVTSSIQALDVSSVGGAGKYISAISEMDGKISATATTMDTTPTASSTNAVTSGGIKTALDGKANDSAVVHKTGTETISGVKTFSDASSVFSGKCASDINGLPLSSAYGAFRTELGTPTLEERGVIEETYANQLECLAKSQVVYETSPKGTETWTTLTVPDSTHKLLWGGNVRGSLVISKNVDFRITINAPYYCWLNFLYFYASGYGATFHIKLEMKSKSSGAWSVVSDTALTSIGWPGHNTIRHGNLSFGGTYDSVRLTLYMLYTGDAESYPSYGIEKFRYYGGYPYKSDPWIVKNGSTGVTSFPKGITSGVAIPISSGGTGKTTAKGASNAILGNMNAVSSSPEDVSLFTFKYVTPTDDDGALYSRTGSQVWSYFKYKMSSDTGVNISGNAATATKATQDSDGNAINATYFKSSGNTTLVSGTATKIGTQNGADVKLTLPTIPSGTQLIYDCGTGSTSTTDFDNALAAFNAGKWVIIHDSGNLPYYCVGSYSGPGLRFKVLASETSLLKVYTLNWTRGSAPSTGTQLEAALVGHTHSNYVPTSRTINGAALTGNLSAADIGLPSTWNSASGPTYGIALDEGGIDQSLKNISASTGNMTTDTYFLVHDAIGESSRWYARKINKLWDWVQDKIAAVLRLYTRNNDTPYFDGLAANAVQATKSTNADITRTADTTNGDKLQIGTGTAVNITNAAHAKYADGAGNATNALAADYASTSGKAYEDGNGTTLAPLVVQYNTGSFPDVFNQLEAAYSSKRRIFCKHGLTIAGSTDTVELKIPLSGVRFSSSGSIRTFEFATQLTQRTSSADNAGQTIAISANHLENGSYNWGIAFDWPYHSDTSDVAGTAGTAGTADTAKNYDVSAGTIKTALDGKAPVSHNHSASDITSGTFGASRLDIGEIRKSGDYLVPRMPLLWANGNVDLLTNTNSVLSDVRTNGYGTPITVINGTASTITVSGIYPNKESTTIPARKSKVFTFYNPNQGFFDPY